MTKFGTIFSILFTVTAGSALAEGHASGDPAAGEKGFNKCKSCHSIITGDDETIVKGGKTGPNLFGLPVVAQEAQMGSSMAIVSKHLAKQNLSGTKQNLLHTSQILQSI